MDHQGNEWGKINFRELAAIHGFPHLVIPNSTLFAVSLSFHFYWYAKILNQAVDSMNLPSLPHSQLLGIEHFTEKTTNSIKVRVKRKELRPTAPKELTESYDLLIGADGPQSDVSSSAGLFIMSGTRSFVETERAKNTFTCRTVFCHNSSTSVLSCVPNRGDVVHTSYKSRLTFRGPGSVLCMAPTGDNKVIVWGLFK